MKRYMVLLIIFILITAVSCDYFNYELDASEKVSEINLLLPSASAGTKVVSTTSGDGYNGWIRAYDSSRCIVSIGGPYGTTAPLSWDETNSRWKGSMYLASVSGEITFLAVVFDKNSQVKYRGWQTITISDSNRYSPISLLAEIQFSLGDIGPGGGYIFYDNPSYATDGWRYLEAAPADFSYDWDASYLDTGFSVTNGDVYQDGNSTAVYTKKDFYWGPVATSNPKASLGTLPGIGKGSPNFTILDAASSATPKIRKGNGRKALATEGNPRRDTPDSLKAQALNGLSDWFVPSENELTQMHANSAYVPGIAEQEYWSSTEAATVTTVGGLEIPNARAVHMGSGTASDQMRDSLRYVRSARRFK